MLCVSVPTTLNNPYSYPQLDKTQLNFHTKCTEPCAKQKVYGYSMNNNIYVSHLTKALFHLCIKAIQFLHIMHLLGVNLFIKKVLLL